LRESVICYLIAFAVGGLLGDVFFHTLPHLNSNQDHSHSHDHSHEGHGHQHDPKEMMMNLIIIGGIVTFFLIEKIVESCFGKSHDHSSHSHSH